MNPDAKIFAKLVLWHLAGLRADVTETQALVVALGQGEKGVAFERSVAQEKSKNENLQRKIYQEPGDPPLPPSRL